MKTSARTWILAAACAALLAAPSGALARPRGHDRSPPRPAPHPGQSVRFHPRRPPPPPPPRVHHRRHHRPPRVVVTAPPYGWYAPGVYVMPPPPPPPVCYPAWPSVSFQFRF